MPRALRLLVVAALAALALGVPGTATGAAPQPLVITTTHLADGQVGVAYAATLKATGGNFGRAWSLVSGSLPTGINLSAQGKLAGTPTTSGPVIVTVAVHDTAKPRQTATATIDFGINPMVVTTTSVPSSLEGKQYSYQLTAKGGTKPLTWSIIDGSLPAGAFKLSSAGRITGVQAFFTGPSTFTVQAKDKFGNTAVRALTMAVSFMHFTNAPTLPVAHHGRLYSVTFKHVGGCATAQGSAIYGAPGGASYPAPILPAGLKLRGAVLSGVPTTAGTYVFRIAAQCNPSNIFAPYAIGDFTLSVS
jgi:hypothetical protein